MAMRIVVISPGFKDPREISCMKGFFAAGLKRYHVRKPTWSAPVLEAWLRSLPEEWRPKLILHQHHSLVETLRLGGRHYKDGDNPPNARGLSRSCHDLKTLRKHMGAYPQVLFGPVFPSLSKPGHGPAKHFPWGPLAALLRERTYRGCRVLAVGGITAERLARCDELGFDGAAVLGAVWHEPDPVRAFAEVMEAAAKLEPAHRGA